MQQFFFSLLSWRLFTAQHVSGVFPPIIRSSITAVAASGFTLVLWTQHGCHHNTKVKPEVATAVIELLIPTPDHHNTCLDIKNGRCGEHYNPLFPARMSTPYLFSTIQHIHLDQTNDTKVCVLATPSMYISELYTSFAEETSIVL